MQIMVLLLAVVAAACGGGGPNTMPGCDDSRTECNGVCVDTQGDPLHCGDCGVACAVGDVCLDGACTTWDCREAPCPGLAFCDLSTGTCLAGCAFTDQCGPNEACELASHTCECQPDAHRCSGACSLDSTVATCGDRCDPCPGDPNGDAICTAGACSLACDAGTKLCGGRCAECPAGTSFGCDGDQCVPNNCGAGFLLCDGACADCPVGEEFGCDGGACIATSCPAGYELCDGSCATCPNALETACDGAACIAVACPAGQVVCATGCCSWQFDDVTTTFANGLDLALGAGGVRAISFITSGGTTVRVARKAGAGAWTTETVSSDHLPVRTAVALDSTGAPRVTYTDGNGWVLRVATKIGAAWSVAAPAINLTGAEVSMAIDAANVSHVLYEGSDGLRHAFGNPINNSELVPTETFDQEEGPVMVIDGEGSLHVAYINITDDELAYVRRGASWNLSQTYVPPDGTIGGPVAVAASTAADAQIAYWGSDGLHVAHYNGASWDDVLASTTEPFYAAGTAMAVDPTTGAAHVVFFDTSQRVVYTHWTGTQWAEQVLAPSAAAVDGQKLAIEIDATGHPYIAFPAATTGGIRFAR